MPIFCLGGVQQEAGHCDTPFMHRMGTFPEGHWIPAGNYYKTRMLTKNKQK
jgi:hypothetical protein